MTGPRKPALSTTRSEGALMIFTNGHHKPAYKHNDMAHKCGAPYKIPRSHTVHGHSDMAQRSLDNLPLTVAPAEAALSPLQDSINSAQRDVRLSRSEHGSPRSQAVSNANLAKSALPPLDLSLPAFDTFSGAHGLPLDNNGSNNVGFDCYYSPSDVDQMNFSAGLTMPPVDWSAFDLPLDTAFSAAYSQPPSYASLDPSNIGQPGLTTSSSGELSEADELKAFDALSPSVLDQNHAASESSDMGDSEAYRLSTTSSYLGIPQMSMLASGNLESIDIDSFLKGTASVTSAPTQGGVDAPMDADAFVRHGLTVQDAQKLAHGGADVDATRDVSLPVTRDSADPLWAAPFNEHASFDPEGDVPDTVWTS